MRAVRLIFAGVIAVTALVAGFFAAAVILATGVLAYLVQLFWKRRLITPADPAPRGDRQPSMRTDDVIDVVATKVPDDSAER